MKGNPAFNFPVSLRIFGELINTFKAMLNLNFTVDYFLLRTHFLVLSRPACKTEKGKDR